MTVKTFTNMHDFTVQLRTDMSRRNARVRSVAVKAAWATRQFIADNLIPVASGDARRGLGVRNYGDGQAAVISASDHAAPLESGARPHMPPVEPLIAWVKLRGMQGLTRSGRITTSRDWRKAPAIAMAKALKGQVRARSLSVSAPSRIAWAIAMSIAKNGTKPTWYMRDAMPFNRAEVARLAKEAMAEQ